MEPVITGVPVCPPSDCEHLDGRGRLLFWLIVGVAQMCTEESEKLVVVQVSLEEVCVYL